MQRSEYILTLLNLPKIGRKTVFQILKCYDSLPNSTDEIKDILDNFHQKIKRIRIPNNTEIDKANDSALRTLDDSDQAKISTFSYGDKKYPSKMISYYDPPVILFAKGNIDSLESKHSIAIVGTREPTKWGYSCGEKISKSIADNGLSVVSGLAKGCDTAGHRGCLDGGGKTIAIVAHGLQMIYPATNKKLAQEIVDSGGCIISEYSIGTKPRANFFVERDRLQTALSDAVFFIETGIKGGTMHAVKECIKVGKPLACLKPRECDLTLESVQGNLSMINEGKSISISNDIDLKEFLNDYIFNSKGIAQTVIEVPKIPQEQDLPF